MLSAEPQQSEMSMSGKTVLITGATSGLGLATALRGIAATLNHSALRTRRGTPWRLESVARVVKQAAF
ncbi:MAG: hypothetical protein WA213_18860 [Terriglobales bacterium]